MEFIGVNDVTNDRKTSLGMEDKTLRVIGILPHNTDITFDEANARKLIHWLQTNVLPPAPGKDVTPEQFESKKNVIEAVDELLS